MERPSLEERFMPAMIAFAIMSATLMTIPATLIDQCEKGIVRSYRVNGVPTGSLITIPVVGTVGHMTIVAAILTVLSALLYGAPLPVRSNSH